MRLFDGLKTMYREMTVNENVELNDKDIQKEVEWIIAQQERNLKKLAIDVSNDNTISLKDGKCFMQKEKVNEGKAGKRAQEVMQQKRKEKDEQQL